MNINIKDNLSSNITVKSNIFSREGKMSKDINFLQKISGHNALDKARELGILMVENFTEIQKKEFFKDVKCTYSNEGDINYGKVCIDGQIKWDLRCENYKCENFSDCMPRIRKEDIDKKFKEISKRRLDFEEFLGNLEILENEVQDFYPTIEKDFLEIEKKEGDLKEDFIEKIETQNIEEELKVIEKQLKEKCSQEIEQNGKLSKQRFNFFKKQPIYKGKIVEQEEIINSSLNDKIFVDAGPGTGKTYIVIERLKKLLQDGQVKPDEILVLCFTRAAIGEIQKRLKDINANLKVNSLYVRTFDSFASDFLYSLEQENINLNDYDFDGRIEQAIIELNKNKGVLIYKYLIVDEIQDLVGVRARLVQTLLESLNCGFILLGDLCQAIYDYQIKDIENEIDSVKFQDWLCKNIKNLKIYNLECNHRFNSMIGNYNNCFREIVLLKDDFNKVEKLKTLISEFPLKDFGSKTHRYIELHNIKNSAFLMRDNYQVLSFSYNLKVNNIPHRVIRNLKPDVLDPFWGKALPAYHKDTLSYDEFKYICTENSIIDSYEIDEKWESLKSLVKNGSSRLETSELFQNFHKKQNKSNNLFLNEQAEIIVSTIHQAKGKEFKNVYFIYEEDRFDYKDITEEAKVYYVAATRAMEELNSFNFKYKKFRKKINYDDRFVQIRGYFKKKGESYIDSVEVGIKNDIDSIGFVSKELFLSNEGVEKNQEYIMSNVKRGDEILLRICPINNEFYYKIFHITNEKEHLIGKMSLSFSRALFQAYKQIRNFPGMNPKFYPYEIHQGLFVDNLCSYTKDYFDDSQLPKKYKDRCVWSGITITGLGSTSRRT